MQVARQAARQDVECWRWAEVKHRLLAAWGRPDDAPLWLLLSLALPQLPGWGVEGGDWAEIDRLNEEEEAAAEAALGGGASRIASEIQVRAGPHAQQPARWACSTAGTLASS